MDGRAPYPIDLKDTFETSGSNQTGMRERNERLALTMLRRQGPLPKAEIARRTGLSAQTVSVIMRALEKDGLIAKGEKQRGKIGQPSVPMCLAPEGANFFGLKVGRRSAELTLVDFVGVERHHITKNYAYPTPRMILDFAQSAADEICSLIPTEAQSRIAGLGIATPFFLWEWASIIGVDPDDMAVWRDFDLKAEVAGLFDFPVFLSNDATSACGAELTFGSTETPPDFLYIYIGYFVGGGIVLNGSLFTGRSGNAGSIGPFSIMSADGTTTQLVDKASLIGLERKLAQRLGNTTVGVDLADNWLAHEPEIVEQWISEAVPPLVQLITGACSIIDFSAVLIDGNMHENLRTEIVSRVTHAVEKAPMSGLLRPDVIAGSLGTRARPLGAASLPLSNRFILET